ncbi:AraC family transcriptional regulator [Flavitalea sp. BT771]|uniref:helix-turn-helix domain-containing protein n=1 Tax=Flavitalea sp. BT771 TaxID=3063329 RepID=UPI0026E3A5B4|nr:AraC family transcriptional regulator [Flavitalea sp. BT771]MDO6432724.1 AraC family transcriptional regulator [Flavitalea sp. BT771]MDV6222000.1 AraC family transcriptional regulator [Flavitalea sp. BT771]
MYFTTLPDHTDPTFDEQLHFSRFKQRNIIFNASSYKSHCQRHVGCLSIKTIFSGEEWYGIDRHQLVVRPGQFLILNDDQEYACRMDSAVKVRAVSVFFRNEFASAVLRDALCREENLLDTPFETGGQPLEFFQTLYDTDPSLEEKLLGLVNALDENGYDSNMVDERLVFLLHHLIRTHKKEAERARRVSAVKAATRNEIHRRLCIAKDLLHSNFMEQPDLASISHLACMSVPQLVRQFKAVFRTTPHQYLIRLRLAHAARLLQQSSMPVHEITWMCGFQNTSAFCRAFRTAYGLPPLDFKAAS